MKKEILVFLVPGVFALLLIGALAKAAPMPNAQPNTGVPHIQINCNSSMNLRAGSQGTALDLDLYPAYQTGSFKHYGFRDYLVGPEKEKILATGLITKKFNLQVYPGGLKFSLQAVGLKAGQAPGLNTLVADVSYSQPVAPGKKIHLKVNQITLNGQSLGFEKNNILYHSLCYMTVQ